MGGEAAISTAAELCHYMKSCVMICGASATSVGRIERRGRRVVWRNQVGKQAKTPRRLI